MILLASVIPNLCRHLYCPVSTVRMLKTMRYGYKKNTLSGHIPLSFSSVPLMFLSYYNSLFRVLRTKTNVLNSLDFVSQERGKMQNNVTRTWEEWTRMREDARWMWPKSLFFSIRLSLFSTFVTVETEKYTWAQTVHNTPVMNILKCYFYITLF